jgi:hypothetical protein
VGASSPGFLFGTLNAPSRRLSFNLKVLDDAEHDVQMVIMPMMGGGDIGFRGL